MLPSELASVTYPSGRTVTTCYDDQGRVIWASQVRTVADCTSGNWAGKVAYGDVAAYWPHGAIKTLNYGNGLVESSQYASRLQPMSLSLGGVWQVGYEYGTTENNGNLRKQTLTVPGMSTITQAHKYDGANRLQVVAEQPVNPSLPACNSSGDVFAGGWCHNYSYDGWGNRGVTSPFPLPITTPLAYDPATNRILGGNWGYTARGEINLDPTARTFAYDAEGHLKQTTGANGTTAYLYDAQGERVRKDTPGGSTVYAYDAFGNLGTEYFTVAQSASCQTCYLTPDHLGSTRVVTSPTGQPVARHDYEPFGGEISFGTSSPRYGVAGYGAADTDIDPRFTSQLRDFEMSLDYFRARYHSSAQGRFTSPDPNMSSALLTNPQSWNRYSYVLNNPSNMIDPDGEFPLAIIGMEVLRGAAIGGIVSGSASAIVQYASEGKIDRSKLLNAAAGGALAGALTGGLGGLEYANMLALRSIHTTLIAGGANVVAGGLNRGLNEAAGKSDPSELSGIGAVAADFFFGIVGLKPGQKIVPAARQINLLAIKRSLRPAAQAANLRARQAADARRAAVGGLLGAIPEEALNWGYGKWQQWQRSESELWFRMLSENPPIDAQEGGVPYVTSTIHW